MRVLWLEDSYDMMHYDEELLSKLSDIELDKVETPHELMSRLSQNKYDLLMLDIMFPMIKKLAIEEKEYYTDNGLETGFVLYEYFIKDKYDIPTIFYTSRALTTKLTNKVDAWAKAVLIHKKEINSKLIPMLENFIKNGILK